jgi:sugar/nucleoside kinase (ribokinase family)
VFTKRGIDTRGIERAAGLSFHWTGAYAGTLAEAQTLGTDLNVFERFEPKIPAEYEDSEYLFLANIDPVLQARVRSHMPKVKMVCGDTMNYWIKDHTENLKKVLRELDVLLINDGEARMLSGETNAVKAAEKVLALGPKSLVVKHGEYGATAFFGDRSFFGAKSVPRPFRAPALPLAEVVDPTGAGDSFAGGFYGYLASQPELTPAVFRRAMFYGGVMGSFACERFGTERLQAVTREEIEARFELFREISHLDTATV